MHRITKCIYVTIVSSVPCESKTITSRLQLIDNNAPLAFSPSAKFERHIFAKQCIENNPLRTFAAAAVHVSVGCITMNTKIPEAIP